MQAIEERIQAARTAIRPLDRAAMEAARRRIDTLTKPPGSLGRLEALAVQMAGIQGTARPAAAPGTVVVAAADHGVTAQGVSPYPSEVTAQMVHNFLAGGAAINALARVAGLGVRVVDVGVATDVDAPGLDVRKPRAGTADFVREPAMARGEALAAVGVGLDLAAEEAERGTRLVIPGEMGIGNTTAASAITAAIAGLPPEEVVGRGTGVDEAGLERKRRAVREALALHRPDPADPWDVLTKVGGLEIGCLAGLILGAAAHRLIVLLDGFISGAAALLATRFAPAAAAYLIAGHRSAEAGHVALLRHLGLEPLLALDLRLGEGSGAAAAAPLLAAACAFAAEMASFAEAGVAAAEGEAPPS